jgi:hypothetical protein
MSRGVSRFRRYREQARRAPGRMHAVRQEGRYAVAKLLAQYGRDGSMMR